MTAPNSRGISLVADIQGHARAAVAELGEHAPNPYDLHSDHHAVWQQAADAALAQQPEEQVA